MRPTVKAREQSAPPVAARIQVRCKSSVGFEETIVVPLSGLTTVSELLQRISSRTRKTPPEDVQVIELDGSEGVGGRLFEEDLLQDVLKDGDKIWTHPGDSVAPTEGIGGLSDSFENEADNLGEAEAVDSTNDIEVEEAEDAFAVEDDDQDSECPTPPPVVPDFSKTKAKAAAVSWPKAQIREEPKEPFRPRPSGRTPQQPRTPPWRPLLKPVERSRSPPRKPANVDPARTASSSSTSGPKESLAPKEWPPLLQAVYNNDLRKVKELLRGGAHINCCASGQKTPIYYAIRFELLEITKCLLEHPDIDLNMQMKSSKGSWTTPLDIVRAAGPSCAVYSVFQAAGYLGDQPTGFKQTKLAPREPSYPPPQRPLNAGATPAPSKSAEPPEKKTGTAVQYSALYARRRANYGKNGSD